jgi:hypothetical protein
MASAPRGPQPTLCSHKQNWYICGLRSGRSFYELIYEAFSIVDYNSVDGTSLMNWNGFGRKWLWPVWDIVPRRDLEISRNISVVIASIPANIRIYHKSSGLPLGAPVQCQHTYTEDYWYGSRNLAWWSRNWASGGFGHQKNCLDIEMCISQQTVKGRICWNCWIVLQQSRVVKKYWRLQKLPVSYSKDVIP